MTVSEWLDCVGGVLNMSYYFDRFLWKYQNILQRFNLDSAIKVVWYEILTRTLLIPLHLYRIQLL